MNDRTRQFAEYMFLLAVVGAGNFGQPAWVLNYEEHHSEAAQLLEEAEAESAAFRAVNAKQIVFS